MSRSIDHVKRVQDAIDNWLRPDNSKLKDAIEQTVEEGFFSFPDIKHQVRSLKKNLSSGAIQLWLDKIKSEAGQLRNFKILCLHAGNLPLAGVQDVIAAALTGSGYYGKISRKDPYLLPTFIQSLKDTGGFNDFTWSTNIRDLKNTKADAILFSGSTRSVEDVQTLIHQLNLAGTKADYLIRTAYFSVAYIDRTDPHTMKQLTEAVFRYGGKGCRSVAAVISPFSLDSLKCEFTDYIESFWLHNPQHVKPKPALYYRYAYNKAVGHSQSWLDDFLIEETDMKPDQDFVLNWIQGDEKRLNEYVKDNPSGLQAVYTPDGNLQLNSGSIKTEKLELAQSPPVYWRPDGVDTIQWLNQVFHRS
jgi:hypothetical protein